MNEMPSNFGLKYILWFFWSNAITSLMVVQVIFATLALDESVPHNVAHWCLIGNAVVTAVVAQVKKSSAKE